MRIRWVPVCLVACVSLSSCGLRVDDTTRQTLLEQSLGRGAAPGAQVGAGAPEEQQGLVVGPSAAPATGPGGGPATTRTGTGGAAGTSGVPAVGSTAPAGGNGGATDLGVTATSITVGTVADRTGPQPGLFDGDIAGVQAYFAYVNSQGGVNGRMLKTKVADSQTDCNQTTNAYRSLVSEVFAFVGNLSNYDNCGAAVLKANPKVPDVSHTLTEEHFANPATFSAQPLVAGARTGPPRVFAAAFPEVKGAVGGLYANVASAKSQWLNQKEMLLAEGFTIVYEQSYPATQVDFTQYVIGMRQANVKMAQLFSSVSLNAKFINAAQQQGFNPPVITAPGVLYDPTFAQLVGTTPTNLYTDMPNALYANGDEARIRGVGLYQEWMKRTVPDRGLDYFSVFGWEEAALFVQALRDAGPEVTRAGLLEALRKIRSFDADGLIASGDPGAKRPVSCYLVTKYAAGTWSRWKTPATGFRCDAPYYFAKG